MYKYKEKSWKMNRIQSVQRAIDIINCIENAKRSLSLNEISSQLGLNINTARGLAQTLLANGYLSKDTKQGTYKLFLKKFAVKPF